MSRACPALGLVAAAVLMSACGGDSTVEIGNGDYQLNLPPPGLRVLSTQTYDGSSDDLLTAGLGRTGLASAVPPALSSPPTAAELRRLAIHTNYRAIVDTTAGGGFGTLYGPNVAVGGAVGTGEGLVGGTEILASMSVADAGGSGGAHNLTMLVQIPSGFSAGSACIVTAPSSGSRGVYGAVAIAEWAFKRNCAVAYTDKGTGSGVHDLGADTVNLIDGRRSAAAAAGMDSNFTARLSEAERLAFNATHAHRIAVKHAHSEANPEAAWGEHVRLSLEFALWALNDRFSPALADGRKTVTITPANTRVIAAGVSNGGGAALAAALQDSAGLIDGVVVSEPNIQLPPGGAGSIERAGLPAYTAGSRPLYDYFSYANLLQPCAALAPALAASPFGYSGATAFVAANRCAVLARDGLVTGATQQAQAEDALARLHAYGWEPDTDLLQASHFLFATPAIAVTYGNAHGRFRVTDRLCSFSFAAVNADNAPAPAAAGALAGIFGTGNGIPPTGPIQLIYDDSVGGARTHGASVTPSTGAFDFAYDGAACLRQLWTGSGVLAERVRGGVTEVQQTTASLGGKPTIIVHGRSDTLIPVNFSSRPFVLRNAQQEGAGSRLRYFEVTNAQHFDAFLPFPGYDTRYVPLHHYHVQALDLMWAHLSTGAALPPSQVVRTTPRGGTPGAANAISAANVPPIAAAPAAGDRITVEGTTLRIPN